jgi:hypothetical protein
MNKTALITLRAELVKATAQLLAKNNYRIIYVEDAMID